MKNNDLNEYCQHISNNYTQSKQIDPDSVITAPWVQLKCQFGCPMYDRSYCCPPHTPTYEQTRAILDSYDQAILIRYEAPPSESRGNDLKKHYETLTKFEGTLFKNGYYKAILFLSGPCVLCKECALLKNELCTFRNKARPSMEACGIDVYQTVRNNGFTVHTLSHKTDTQTHYCLMLVD